MMHKPLPASRTGRGDPAVCRQPPAAAGSAQSLPAAVNRARAAAGGQPVQHGRGELAAAQGGGARPVPARLLRPWHRHTNAM